MTDPQQQALPPLPERLCVDDDRAWFSESQMRAYATEAVARALAASAPSREVPDGWKLVPIEPTLAMVEAGRIKFTTKADTCRRWASMLAASPSPSVAAEETKP